MKRFSLTATILFICAILHFLGYGGEVTNKDLMATLLMVFSYLIIEFKSLYEDL